MHYLTPVFATLDSKNDDVIKMSAMVEDYATALNRKSILHVRLKGLVGDDNLKVGFVIERGNQFEEITPLSPLFSDYSI